MTVEGFEMRPFFAGCDACGAPFSTVAFGGRGNMNDHQLYELCVACVERLSTTESPELVARVHQALLLRYAKPQGQA